MNGRIGLLNYPLYDLAHALKGYKGSQRPSTGSPTVTTGSTTVAVASVKGLASARSTWPILPLTFAG